MKYTIISLILLLSFHISCKDQKKEKREVTGTDSANINQVNQLIEDDKLVVLSQEKETSEDISAFVNPEKARKRERLKDSIRTDSIRKDSIRTDSITRRKDSIRKDSITRRKDSIKKVKQQKRRKNSLDKRNKNSKKNQKKKNQKTSHNDAPTPPQKKKLSQGGQSLAIKKEHKQRLYKAKIERSIILNPSQRTQISLRLEESVKINDKEEIPKYYEITGYTILNQDRLIISFQNTIINNQIVNIEDIKVYDTDKILGLKVYLKEAQNKKQIVSTASKIASNVASIALKSTTSSIANTVVRDAQSYGSKKIYNNITIEKNRPLYLQFTRQK